MQNDQDAELSHKQVLEDMTARVRVINQKSGFRDDPAHPEPSFLEAMALLHTEVSEAVEAWRKWGFEDHTEPVKPYWDESLQKPEGVGSELADVLIRLLDSANLFGIDLAGEFERKLAYNATRSYRHGGKRM